MPRFGSNAGPNRLLGGAGICPKLTVGDVRVFQVVAGHFDWLYNEDQLLLCQLRSGEVLVSPHEICCRLPLHVVAPFVLSTTRSQLVTLIPCDIAARRIPVSELRSIAVSLCCAGSCKFVYAVFRRPENSVVNPFHINRDAARAQLPAESQHFGDPSQAMSTADRGVHVRV